MVFIAANFPVGLVIYWAWNGILSIMQQVYIMKNKDQRLHYLQNLKNKKHKKIMNFKESDVMLSQISYCLTKHYFSKGVTKIESLPIETVPEVAFFGRSNVGKSSLLNSITNKSKLAYTSKSPG